MLARPLDDEVRGRRAFRGELGTDSGIVARERAILQACMTSELRELVSVPIACAASKTRTSRPAIARRRAQASPTTPAPITAQSIFSDIIAPNRQRNNLAQMTEKKHIA